MKKTGYSKFIQTLTLLISIFFLRVPVNAKYSGGRGEPNDPYQIATAEDLMLLGETTEDCDKHFIVITNIDLDPNLPGRKVFDRSVIAPDVNDTKNWHQGIPFSGAFDGNGHTIFHLTIIGKSNLGLFGLLKNGATISNLGLEKVNVNGTSDCIGGLVSENSGGIIVNCYTIGNVSGSRYVGGLTGNNSHGTVAYCYSTGTVSGESWIGGLVGFNESEITNCYAANKVLGTKLFGGLVGYSETMYGLSGINNSYFLSARDDGGPDNGFGFPLTDEQMKKPDSFFDWDFAGRPDGPDDIWAEPVEGGYPILWWQLSPLPELPFPNGKGEPNDPYLISTAEELNSIGHNPRLMDAHFKLVSDIDLAGTDFFIIGSDILPFSGVLDGNDHTISNFNHTTQYVNFVGLFGYVKGPRLEIRDLGLINPNISLASGDVGSLAGYFGDGTISNCYVEGGSVNGYGEVGGLVGSVNGSITNCHSSTTVSGMSNVGGLAGWIGGLIELFSDQDGSNEHTGIISNCYSTGSVSGDRNVGGIVGNNSGYITKCYTTGNVSGAISVGGLVGVNAFGRMMNCYSRADVTGDNYVGGLVGLNFEGNIRSSYSVCSVIGNEKVGGLVGENTLIPNQQVQYNTGIIDSSFWNIETSGQTTSAGGTGKTTAEMQTAETFLEDGWDFVGETENGTEDIWWILEGQDYPKLWWENDGN